MFLAFKAAGATDWRSNLAIAIDHSGKQHRLQFHHIFPKSVLKTHATDREADDIANLAFIGGGTNRRISDKPPSDYIPPIVANGGSEPFVSQGIPLDEKFLQVQAYKEFLGERRKIVAHMLNKFLGTDDVGSGDGRTSAEAAPPPASVLVNTGEGVATEFKSTLRVNVHTGQNDIRMEREVLKTLAAFLNSNGGSLVIGVNDKGKPTGLEVDNFHSEDKMNLHLVNLIRDRMGGSADVVY